MDLLHNGAGTYDTVQNYSDHPSRWVIREGVRDKNGFDVTWASDPDSPVVCFGLTSSGTVVALIPGRSAISTTLTRCDDLYSKEDNDVALLYRREEDDD